jgi:hypothetical protein
LLPELHGRLDKRPVRRLLQAVETMVALWDQNHGVLLSELRPYMDGLGKGGGTKRLGTLIHHPTWKAQQIEEFRYAARR